MHSCLCVLHALLVTILSTVKDEFNRRSKICIAKTFFANKSYKTFLQMYQLKYSVLKYTGVPAPANQTLYDLVRHLVYSKCLCKAVLDCIGRGNTSLSVSRYTLHLQQTLAVIAYEFSRPVLQYHIPENTVSEKTCKVSATTLHVFIPLVFSRRIKLHLFHFMVGLWVYNFKIFLDFNRFII